MPYVLEASFDVPECRTQHHFPGCRASAPRVPELTPRPYPVDSPTTLRVFSEHDTCPAKHISPGTRRLRRMSRVSPSRRPLGCRPAARESAPEDPPPGHSTSAPRVDHPGNNHSVYFEK